MVASARSLMSFHSRLYMHFLFVAIADTATRAHGTLAWPLQIRFGLPRATLR